jgi:hypothetical protein
MAPRLGVLLQRFRMCLLGYRAVKEEQISRLKALAALLTAIAALGSWLLPKTSFFSVVVITQSSSSQVTEQEVEKSSTIPPKAEETRGEVARAAVRGSDSSRENLKVSDEGSPLEFDLADNEQKIVLSGRASLAIQFNNISGEEFPTLRLNIGEESTPYPILGSGKRIRFECAGRDYYVSVLGIDISDKVVRLRVDAAP